MNEPSTEPRPARVANTSPMAIGKSPTARGPREHAEAGGGEGERDDDRPALHPGRPADVRDADRRRGHSSAKLRRRTRATKNGAPRTAVRMPTCTSPGRAMSRPATSAVKSDVGASTADHGSSHRWSGPQIARATWGTVRPMNPIGPAAAVAVPASTMTASAEVGRASRGGGCSAIWPTPWRAARRRRGTVRGPRRCRCRARRVIRRPRTGTGRAPRRRAAGSTS